MKIAVVADKKAGHLSQCLGLREILKNYNKDKDLFIFAEKYIKDLASNNIERFNYLLKLFDKAEIISQNN